MIRILSVATIAVVLLAAPAGAQQREDNLTGSRVRVTAPNFLEDRVTGTVTSFTHERLVIQSESTGRRYTLPLRAVSRLDPFRGDSPASTAWYRGRLGAFIGGSLGAILAPAIVKISDQSIGQAIAMSGVTGLVTGATVGAVYGWRNPEERWSWVMSPWGYDPKLRP
jgi:hypothetical protein